jgi:hypothetical protein
MPIKKDTYFYKLSYRARAGKPGDDYIKTIAAFYKSLFMMPIYKEEFYYSAFIPALKSGVFC